MKRINNHVVKSGAQEHVSQVTWSTDIHDEVVDQAKELLKTNGYVCIKNAISLDSTTLAKKTLERLNLDAKSSELRSTGGHLAGHLNCLPGKCVVPIIEEIKDIGINKFIDQSTLAALPSNPGSSNVNVNLPKSKKQHYHIDGYKQDRFLIANVALVETTITNGAIELLPASHKRSIPFWKFCLQLLHFKGVQITMQEGDLLLRYSDLWHRGMPNKSRRARPLVSIRYSLGATEITPLEFTGSQHELPKIVNNWYMSHKLGRAREAAFVFVPLLQTTWRLIRSLTIGDDYLKRQ